MYTSQLFYILSSLAAITVQAAPSHPPAESVVVDTPLPSAVSYAGAPANGEYPDEVAANGGWESDAPTYDTAAATVVWSATISADGSYATPMYGSGSMPATDMDSCYQMCQAQFAPASPAPSGSAASSAVSAGTTGAPYPPASASASASVAPAPAGSDVAPQGGSKTHTIIVAPTQGVLRFVPFAVKAEQGDSLEYIWGGGPHSATLSDGTNICNKSTEAGAFDSGKLNATETFTTVYNKNTTGPTFYYCTVGQHCANGMFGIINPPTSNVSNALTDKATSSGPPRPDSTAGSGSKLTPGVDGWVTSWGLTNPDNQKRIDAVKAACKEAPGSWAWGSNWDWEPMLSATVTKEVIIENTLYTRLMASYNPAMIKGEALTADWKAAPDLTSFAASYTGGSNVTMSGGSASGTAGSSASTSASPTAAVGIAASGNGAGRIGGSSAVLALSVGVVGLALSFF